MPQLKTGLNLGEYQGPTITISSFADKDKIDMLAVRNTSGGYSIFTRGDAFPSLTQLKTGDGFLLFASAIFSLPGMQINVTLTTDNAEQGPVNYDEPILAFTAGEKPVISAPVFSAGGANATMKYSVDGGTTFLTYDQANTAIQALNTAFSIQFQTTKTSPYPATSSVTTITTNSVNPNTMPLALLGKKSAAGGAATNLLDANGKLKDEYFILQTPSQAFKDLIVGLPSYDESKEQIPGHNKGVPVMYNKSDFGSGGGGGTLTGFTFTGNGLGDTGPQPVLNYATGDSTNITAAPKNPDSVITELNWAKKSQPAPNASRTDPEGWFFNGGNVNGLSINPAGLFYKPGAANPPAQFVMTFSGKENGVAFSIDVIIYVKFPD